MYGIILLALMDVIYPLSVFECGQSLRLHTIFLPFTRNTLERTYVHADLGSARDLFRFSVFCPVYVPCAVPFNLVSFCR